MSNYSSKRKQNLVPHFYDRHSRNFGFFDPERGIPWSVVKSQRDQAFKQRAESQAWRDNVIERKVVRHV